MLCKRCFSVLLLLLFVEIAYGAPSEGKEIADRFGEDLSFASKQVIRGFTSIFAPLLDSAQNLPRILSKAVPMSKDAPGSPMSESGQNFQQVLIRDGLNALGKGVKAGATILSTPARVLGTGLHEYRKVGQASADARFGADNTPTGAKPMDDRTKIVSTLLNTTSSQLSQANLGAVLVEVALKNRIKDMANKTASAVVPPQPPPQPLPLSTNTNVEKRDSAGEPEVPSTTSRVDVLLDQFNSSVKKNDERMLEILKAIIARIDPPKNS